MIDQGLAHLKRDPMPGIIKSTTGDETKNLFASSGDLEVDGKVVDLIAKANTENGIAGDEAINSDVEPDAFTGTEPATSEVASDIKGQRDAADTDSAEEFVSEKKLQSAQLTESNTVSKPESAIIPEQARADLQISSSSRVPEKDQILVMAYESYESGDFESARRQYGQVLSLDPENRDAMLGSAAIHVQDREFEQAIELYQQLLLINPKDSMAMTSLISVANIDPQAGESQLKGLLHDQPDSPYLHFALGNMYGIQSRWSEAQSAYFTALQHKPEDPNYAYNLAISLEHLNQPQIALAYYRRALDNQVKGLATFNSQLVGQRIEVLSQ